MIQINTVSPDWGHALLTPEGKEIRVPKSAFEPLRKLGVLERNRAQLKPIIYQLMDREYDDLLMGLRHMLGKDLGGPAWCVCHCQECRDRDLQTENIQMPGRKHPGIDTDKIVREIKARRKAA
jgi:hypothetical protein